MGSWRIDRLALTLPGYSERQARELSQLIATTLLELADTPVRLPAGAERAYLTLELTAREGEAMSELARRIVTALATTE